MKNQKNNGISKFQKAVNKLRKEGFLNKPKGRRNRQTLWGGCTDANPKLLLNDT